MTTSSTDMLCDRTPTRLPRPHLAEHEKRSGQRDENWPDWYAEYIVREQAGKELPDMSSGYDFRVKSARSRRLRGTA